MCSEQSLADALEKLQASTLDTSTGRMSTSPHEYIAADYDWPHEYIAAELLRVTSEGMYNVESAIRFAELLRVPLAYISDTFTTFQTTLFHQQWAGDPLELYAATTLLVVIELLRQQTAQEAPQLPLDAVVELKELLKHAADLVVLAHSRFIELTNLQGKGIPDEMKHRIEQSFGVGVTALSHDVWSRIGNSKYNVFARGLRCKTECFGPKALEL